MSTHAKSSNGGYYITDKTWLRLRQVVLDYYGHRCMSCGYEGTKRMHVDHVLPKRDYPELKYDLMNLQVLCAACNMQKMVDEDDFRSPEMIEGFERYLEEYKARIIEEEGLEHFMEYHEEYGFPNPPEFKNQKEFMGEMFEYKTKYPLENLDRIFRTDLQLEGLNREDKIALLRLLELSSPDNVCRDNYRGYIQRDVVIEPKHIKTDTSNLLSLGYVNRYQGNCYILNPKHFPVEEKYRKQAQEKWLSSHLAGVRKINNVVRNLKRSIQDGIDVHKSVSDFATENEFDWLLNDIDKVVTNYLSFMKSNYPNFDVVTSKVEISELE